MEKFLTHPQNAEEFPQQQKYFFLTGEIVEPFLKWSSREIVDQMEKKSKNSRPPNMIFFLVGKLMTRFSNSQEFPHSQEFPNLWGDS